MALSVGDKVPEFKALDENGNVVSNKMLKGEKYVLYFYPKDNTSGCTKESCDFRDAHTKFMRRGIKVFGVSPDSAKSHLKFKEKYELPFPLLVDEDKSMAEAFGVWQQKSLYGRKYMGIVRSTFVVDEQGRITDIFEKVKVPGHVEEVLKRASSSA